MDTWKRRTAYYLGTLAAVIVGYALAYDYGMTTFEGRPKPFHHSLRIVVETFTTTGYGSDAPWATPEMNAFVSVMDVTGVVLIFMALPVFVVPLFEQAVSTTLPRSVDLEDHVVVSTYSPRAETLIAELDSWAVPYVIVEADRERATELYESGHAVLHGDPESVDTLTAANLGAARALVADAGDEVNVSVVLTAEEVAPDVPVVSVVEDPDLATYHELAGVDRVLTPRRLLGESLASKITGAVSTDLDGGDRDWVEGDREEDRSEADDEGVLGPEMPSDTTVEIGEDFEVAELSVQRDSDVAGATLADSQIREQAGANVVGAWVRGEFRSPPSPELELGPGTILLVTGHETDIDRLEELTSSARRKTGRGEVVVVGYGEVGSTIVDALAAANVPYTVVDLEDKPGVDVVGDTTDPETLQAAGIEDARSVVFAVANDTTTGFGTLVALDQNPTVEVLARAEETENVRKIYRAGADYVLALATVSGRMLASTILEGEQVVSMDNQVEIVRTTAPALAGRTLAEADVRKRTGCTIVAVERNGDVITAVGPEFRLERDDDVIVAGTDEDVNRFTELAH
ncbi:potassium channel family protein [Halorussus litoreus]|uniref:potassium channel family protein n=1 Tax=Halorussus litoreus TaxID=1710536 RepID=UPI000E222D35|nr:NAD-binding protein [Halorussus litoreus]